LKTIDWLQISIHYSTAKLLKKFHSYRNDHNL